MNVVADRASDTQRRAPTYQVLVDDIKALGVEQVFGLMSDDTAVFATALDSSGIRFYGARHENNAIAMAEGFSYATGGLGIAVIGRGPATANGMHAATYASRSGSRVLIIYGDAAASNGAVNSMGPDYKGFNSTGVLGAAGIRTFVATSPETARGALADAAGAALQGGAAALLLPVNVQLADMDLGKALPPPAQKPPRPPAAPRPQAIEAAAALVRQSRKPLIVAGLGAHRAGAKAELEQLADRIGAPFVATVHATEHGRHQGWVDKHPQTYIHGVERWITNRSDRVIACSHYMREQIADIFGVDEERISVIPNGIDPDDLQPQDPAELTRLRAEFAAPEEKLVLLIGRLVYEKGFQLALEAMPRLIEEVPGTRFLIAGSGTHEAELHKQAEELGLMEHGTFLGWIGDDVLHSLYRIADLTVVPSIYEPFGLVALEAMASGCPCIVADTGGLREVVVHEEGGLRFTAKDPRSLGRMVERVLTDDDLRDRLVAEASEHVLRFDWSDVARQTHAAYRSLLGAGAPAPETVDATHAGPGRA